MHHAQPKVISITQTTELGTLYSIEEIKALSNLAKGHGMFLHMDGARISNAAAALRAPLRAFTRDAGVDLLSFGFTKNGAMQAEAVVHWNDEWAKRTPFLRKQMGQLSSKMRYASAQFVAMLQDELYLKNAAHANEMAQYLAAQLSQCRGVRLTQRVQGNAVFAIIDEAVTKRLLERYFFYVWNEATHEVRLMTHFNHTKRDCDDFVALLKTATN